MAMSPEERELAGSLASVLIIGGALLAGAIGFIWIFLAFLFAM